MKNETLVVLINVCAIWLVKSTTASGLCFCTCDAGAAKITPKAKECYDGWTSFQYMCYHAFTERHNLEGAKEFCRTQGGTLANVLYVQQDLASLGHALNLSPDKHYRIDLQGKANGFTTSKGQTIEGHSRVLSYDSVPCFYVPVGKTRPIPKPCMELGKALCEGPTLDNENDCDMTGSQSDDVYFNSGSRFVDDLCYMAISLYPPKATVEEITAECRSKLGAGSRLATIKSAEHAAAVHRTNGNYGVGVMKNKQTGELQHADGRRFTDGYAELDLEGFSGTLKGDSGSIHVLSNSTMLYTICQKP